tara:strand:- start:668 stop:958 length:291 start_codon:yes stop_codon:yes gene_type:complete
MDIYIHAPWPFQFVAGWNKPGYLPDSIESHPTQEEAKAEILDALECGEYGCNATDKATFSDMRASVAQEDGEFDTGSMPDGYNYFVLEGEGFRYEN